MYLPTKLILFSNFKSRTMSCAHLHMQVPVVSLIFQVLTNHTKSVALISMF